MSGLATAIRLRRRELDRIALELATEQARGQSFADRAEGLAQQRQCERHLTAAAPLSCDAWFATSARELAALAEARSASEQALAVLRNDAVQVRARLQLLEDAAAEKSRASRRRVYARADAALDDRIAAAWGRR